MSMSNQVTIAWFGETPETHFSSSWSNARSFIFETARFHRAEGSYVSLSRSADEVSIIVWVDNRMELRMSARREG